MQCPHDQTPLQMTERQGIEIDYCPTCRGVWLDRGELDKIIERAGPSTPTVAATPPPPSRPDPRTESAGYPGQPYGGAPQGTVYPPNPGYQQYPRYGGSPDSPEDYGYGQGDPRYRKRRKREGFLGELFDF